MPKCIDCQLAVDHTKQGKMQRILKREFIPAKYCLARGQVVSPRASMTENDCRYFKPKD